MIRSVVRFGGEDEIHGRSSAATLCGRPIVSDTDCVSWLGDELEEISCPDCIQRL